ncbi:hypothetical protein Tco_0922793 [Tanacetum coccineum]|uniref:BEN domain-containing protein n=1 Tax=Tanacetum coccineum TaxID=301880 RepID=A0ABQ5D050_9ASTR
MLITPSSLIVCKPELGSLGMEGLSERLASGRLISKNGGLNSGIETDCGCKSIQNPEICGCFKLLCAQGKVKKSVKLMMSSDPSDNIVDDAVHKELGDSLVRVATTASSLEAEQDSGNITKTRSKATPNESSSLGTTSGGGPRCQETMRDTIAQTRFENVSKHSNDSLLARGNTLRSDEDRLKLDELMALCTTLQNRVLDLEKTKTSQHNEIASLKRRVKKLEKKNRSRTHKLKRLYKVGLTARVESSDDEESLGEDASKQGRIDAIDADEEITLVSVHDMNVSAGEEVVEEVVEVINTAKLIINAAQVSDAGDKVSTASATTTVSVATTTTATTVDDITLAQALEELKTTNSKKKRVVIQELGESTTTISSQQSQDKGKGIWIEPVEKKDQILLDGMKLLLWKHGMIYKKDDVDHQLADERCSTRTRRVSNMEGYKLNDLKLKEFDYIPKMFDRAFKRVNTFEDFRTELVECKEKRTGTKLAQEITKK